MLDAAEEILREEGYAELTSRKVAEHLGVKQRLVYYYFRTMEELTLATFRRLALRELDRLKSAIASDTPLHEIWNICMNTSDARLVSEFMAIANRNEGVRHEVVRYIEESRKIQIAAFKKVLSKSDTKNNLLQPDAIAFMGTSLALALNREATLGVTKGHAAVNKMVKQFFNSVEP